MWNNKIQKEYKVITIYIIVKYVSQFFTSPEQFDKSDLRGFAVYIVQL